MFCESVEPSIIGEELAEEKDSLFCLEKLEHWLCTNFGVFMPKCLDLEECLKQLHTQLLDPMVMKNCSKNTDAYYSFHWSNVMSLLQNLDWKLLDNDFFLCLFYCLLFSLKFNDDEHLENSDYAHLAGIPMYEFGVYEWVFFRALDYNVFVPSELQIEMEKCLYT